MEAFSTVGALTFTLEPLDACYEESKPLQHLHWLEVAKNKELMQLDVDEDYYRRADKTKEVLYVIARHESRMVGYMVWLVYLHPHYKKVLCAQNDVHFMLPEYRRGMNGYNMIKESIRLVKTIGVQMCYMREKIGHEHPAILKRLGFSPMDITYSCNLTLGDPK